MNGATGNPTLPRFDANTCGNIYTGAGTRPSGGGYLRISGSGCETLVPSGFVTRAPRGTAAMTAAMSLAASTQVRKGLALITATDRAWKSPSRTSLVIG